MDLGSIASAISSLKATFDLASSAIDARDQAKLNELRIALTNQLLDLSNKALALQEQLFTSNKEKAEFEEQIRNLSQQLEDTYRYQPHHFETGTIAFVDSQHQSTEPPIYFCAACMTERKKTILQLSSNRLFLSCPFGHPDISISNKMRSLMAISSHPRLDFSGY